MVWCASAGCRVWRGVTHGGDGTRGGGGAGRRPGPRWKPFGRLCVCWNRQAPVVWWWWRCVWGWGCGVQGAAQVPRAGWGWGGRERPQASLLAVRVVPMPKRMGGTVDPHPNHRPAFVGVGGGVGGGLHCLLTCARASVAFRVSSDSCACTHPPTPRRAQACVNQRQPSATPSYRACMLLAADAPA